MLRSASPERNRTASRLFLEMDKQARSEKRERQD
jgi:hypothetical protein